MPPPSVSAEERGDGSLILRSDHPLGEYETSLAEMFRRTTESHPDRVFLAGKDEAGGWVTVTYDEAREKAMGIAEVLLGMGLSPERPLMVLSGNSVDHGLVMVGCFLSGVPIAPVSVAYSLQSKTFNRLTRIAANLQPGAIFVENAEPFRAAIDTVDPGGIPLITSDASGPDQVSLAELASTKPGPMLESARQSIGPDTVAKILYTSGSTGTPKGVINTHRMLCSNQQSIARVWPFLTESPPVLVDWLPWSHTFGGNHNFNMVMRHGGSMYIDEGRPAPGLIERTVANLADVSPTISFNVPAGYSALLPYLEGDPELADRFLDRLQLIFYAAASLPQDIWARLEELSRSRTGRVVQMTTAWGSTETAPAATTAHFPLKGAGNIGVPYPGVEIKLVRSNKTEIRVRGPNVTPGYWRQPDLTDAAFDEDGFYRIEDAVRMVDPDDPSKGLVFDGRIAEDFKLTTGTWVHVGKLRVDVLEAAAPLLQDVVICGADRDYVSLLAWLNVGETSRLTGLPADSGELAGSDLVRDLVRDRLSAHNAATSGSSRTIRRVVLLTEPPHVDSGEITDKGYINQSAVLERRADQVDDIYSDHPGPRIIEIG